MNDGYLEVGDWENVHGQADWDWQADLGAAFATITAEGEAFTIDLAFGHGDRTWHVESDGHLDVDLAKRRAEELYEETLRESADIARAEAIADNRGERAADWKRH